MFIDSLPRSLCSLWSAEAGDASRTHGGARFGEKTIEASTLPKALAIEFHGRPADYVTAR
jgi:hypothetical protein